jgi:hypothetical protein
LGVRLNSGWQPPKMTAIRYGPPATTDRETAKLEKFKSLFEEPNIDLGQYEKRPLIKRMQFSTQSIFSSAKMVNEQCL